MAGAAASAAVVVEPVPVPCTQLDHRILRARAEAAVALKAIAARQAPAGLVGRLLRGQPADHLGKVADPVAGVQFGLVALFGVAEVPRVEHVERYLLMLVRPDRLRPAQVAVDLPGGLLARSEERRVTQLGDRQR